MTTLDGNPIFGDIITVIHTLSGSACGRRFLIFGVLSAPDIPALKAVEATLLSYADGLPHALTDHRGRTWSNLTFGGTYVPSSQGPCPVANGGWCLPYRLVMTSLT